MLAPPPVQGVPLLRVSARVLERLLALVPPPVLPLQPLLKWLLVRPLVQPQVRQLGMAPLQERLFRGPCLRELANSRPALPGRFCPAPLRWALASPDAWLPCLQRSAWRAQLPRSMPATSHQAQPPRGG